MVKRDGLSCRALIVYFRWRFVLLRYATVVEGGASMVVRKGRPLESFAIVYLEWLSEVFR